MHNERVNLNAGTAPRQVTLALYVGKIYLLKVFYSEKWEVTFKGSLMVGNRNKIWVTIEFSLMSLIAILLLFKVTNPLLIFGVFLTLSKKTQDKLYIGEILYWFSQNVIKPRFQLNYLIWGIVVIVLGVSYQINIGGSVFYIPFDNYKFWSSCVAVLLVNILIGVVSMPRNQPKNNGNILK